MQERSAHITKVSRWTCLRELSMLVVVMNYCEGGDALEGDGTLSSHVAVAVPAVVADRQLPGPLMQAAAGACGGPGP